MKNTRYTALSRRSVLAGSAGLAATLGSWRAWGASQTVKVGSIMPSSGVLAFPGQACVRGVDFGVKYAKERFGVDIQVIHADTQSKPENGRIAAESLIQQGCTALIGAWDSGSTISALQAAEAAKVPMVVHIASANQVTSSGFTQVFRFFPNAETIVTQGLEEMKSIVTSVKDPPMAAAVLHVNNTFGTSSAKTIDKAWEELKMPLKLAARIPYDQKARDLSVEVAKAKASGADTLVTITRVNDAIMITRECVKQGWNPKMIFTPNGNGVLDKAYYDALGKYADGALSSNIWYNPKAPATKKIVEGFEAEYPNQWLDTNSGCAFEAVQIVANAVKTAKSSASDAIHAALKSMDAEPVLMFSGRIKFDASGQNMNSRVALLQATSTAPKVVGPKEIAVAELRYPLAPFDKR